MTKHICYCIATLLALFSCENASTSTATTTLSPQTSSVVPGIELLEALEGFWQNERDPALLLKIQGEKLTRIYNNQASEQCALEAFSDCDNAPCEIDESSSGWCFTEKGANGLQCSRVLKCDSLLYFTTVGNSEVFKFRKVKP